MHVYPCMWSTTVLTRVLVRHMTIHYGAKEDDVIAFL